MNRLQAEQVIRHSGYRVPRHAMLHHSIFLQSHNGDNYVQNPDHLTGGRRYIFEVRLPKLVVKVLIVGRNMGHIFALSSLPTLCSSSRCHAFKLYIPTPDLPSPSIAREVLVCRWFNFYFSLIALPNSFPGRARNLSVCRK